MKGMDDELQQIGLDILKASMNNLQLPKMGDATRLKRNVSGKFLTIDNKFTRNNAMDNVKGHTTLG